MNSQQLSRNNAKHIGCSGYTTASSVPGGVFAAPSAPQNRSRLDGVAGGRGNSSSVPGGIFFGGEVNPAAPCALRAPPPARGGGPPAAGVRQKPTPVIAPPAPRMEQRSRADFDGVAGGRSNSSSVTGGIFSGGEAPSPPRQRLAAPGQEPGGIFGRGDHGEPQRHAGSRSGAAGAPLSALHPSRVGGAPPARGAAGAAGASPHGLAARSGVSGAVDPPPRVGAGDDFLNLLDQAEGRDRWESEQRAGQTPPRSLEGAEEEGEDLVAVAAAAAAELAQEQGLGPAQEEALAQQLFARLEQQADDAIAEAASMDLAAERGLGDEQRQAVKQHLLASMQQDRQQRQGQLQPAQAQAPQPRPSPPQHGRHARQAAAQPLQVSSLKSAHACAHAPARRTPTRPAGQAAGVSRAGGPRSALVLG